VIPLLDVQDISVSLGKFRLKNINFSLEKGEIFVVLGENGSGKTTLLNTIAGFITPSSGKILLEGKNITQFPPPDREMGYIFQSLALFPHMSVNENILYGARFRKIEDANKKFNEVVQLMRIEHILNRKINMLSGGEKQKVALARALILQPKVLLMDEPTSALSPMERARVIVEMHKIFKSLFQTVIFVTHSVADAYKIGDRIAVMEQGEIVQIGKPREVLYHPVSETVASIFGEINKFVVYVSGCKDGICTARTGNTKLFFLGNCKNGEKLNIFIRPEDILLKNSFTKTSARNNLSGIVKNISFAGPLVRAEVNAGVTFVVLITKQSFEELHIEPGKKVYLSFKITAVHPVKLTE
jgi:molybdate/tungstate transport system ATP-binding protein